MFKKLLETQCIKRLIKFIRRLIKFIRLIKAYQLTMFLSTGFDLVIPDKRLWVEITFIIMTVRSCHVNYAFQSESTLYSCLNVNHLAKLANLG